jgi:hypothetical protein
MQILFERRAAWCSDWNVLSDKQTVTATAVTVKPESFSLPYQSEAP